ncbi:MAG: flagellar basal body P-ring protein FlgI [Phycisphaerales bacterium]|nr:flagellar basal body P-ring protein FlgI [Phycisphaerales bacterium]
MPAPFRIVVALSLALMAQNLPVSGQVGGPGGSVRPGEDPTGYDPSVQLTADNIAIQDIARIQGQGVSILRGVGIVTGLGKGKGDKGSELALARPLARLYEVNNIPLPNLEELANASTCALVAIEVTVPAQGARQDDAFDVRITALHSASDLTGGQLILSPLMGPRGDDTTVYALASGTIVIEDKSTPTTGIVPNAAHMLADVAMPTITDTFVLTLQPQYRHYTVASRVADAVNGAVNDPQEGLALSDRSMHVDVARALNDTSILVTIPRQERANVPQFVAMVLSTQVTLSLLQQPAEVRINRRTGSIIFSGNVEISPVAISHKNLMISTLVPAPPVNPAYPTRYRETMIGLDTSSRAREKARIQDLLLAFRTLDVPIEDRINIIVQIHKAGRLHGRLVIE